MKHIAKQAKQQAEKAKGNCNSHFQNFHVSKWSRFKGTFFDKTHPKKWAQTFLQKKVIRINQKKKLFLFSFLKKSKNVVFEIIASQKNLNSEDLLA